MTHIPLFKVEKINNRAWGVYQRDFGSAGGWVFVVAYHTEEEAQNFVMKQ